MANNVHLRFWNKFNELDPRSDDTSSSIQSLINIIFFLKEQSCNHILYANWGTWRYQWTIKKEREREEACEYSCSFL